MHLYHGGEKADNIELWKIWIMWNCYSLPTK